MPATGSVQNVEKPTTTPDRHLNNSLSTTTANSDTAIGAAFNGTQTPEVKASLDGFTIDSVRLQKLVRHE